jgi:hypothetical protein
LLRALASDLMNELVIGPSETEVRSYFNESRIAAAETAWKRSPDSKVATWSGYAEEAPFITRYVLVWSAGVITATSRVVCEAAPEGMKLRTTSERAARVEGHAFTT